MDKKGRQITEAEKKGRQVEQWARHLGIPVEKPAEFPPGIEYLFALKFAHKGPHPLLIECQFRRDVCVMASKVILLPEHEGALSGDDRKVEFVGEIIKIAAMSSLSFEHHLGTPSPLYWVIIDEIYFDGLTKDAFFQRYRKLGGVQVYLNFAFGRAFFGGGVDATKFRVA